MSHWTRGIFGRLLGFGDAQQNALQVALRSRALGAPVHVALAMHTSPGSTASVISPSSDMQSERQRQTIVMRESRCVLAGHDCSNSCNRKDCERTHVCDLVGVSGGGMALMQDNVITARCARARPLLESV